MKKLILAAAASVLLSSAPLMACDVHDDAKADTKAELKTDLKASPKAHKLAKHGKSKAVAQAKGTDSKI
jgi:hypothetical protein